MSPAEHHPGELLSYLRILTHGSQPHQFFDLRYSPPARVMRQRYVSVLRPQQIAQLITALAASTNVYIGAALRDRARGDKTAISGSHLLYIECDDPTARKRLEGFACPPSMVIASGSPGHLHIYWQLRERASTTTIQHINRRLALALHGEPGCTDIARMLRPPSSLNHKHTPPAPVRLLEHDPSAHYTLAELAAELPDYDPDRWQSPPARPPRRHTGRTALDRELLAIPPADYVRVLTGREPNRAGKVLCPLHQETGPSLQLYPDGTFYCFGARCKKGGTIFDFAAALWITGQSQDMPLRGGQFIEVRRRLARTFGLTAHAR